MAMDAPSQELAQDLTFDEKNVEIFEIELPSTDEKPRPVVACEIAH